MRDLFKFDYFKGDRVAFASRDKIYHGEVIGSFSPGMVHISTIIDGQRMTIERPMNEVVKNMRLSIRKLNHEAYIAGKISG